MSDPSRRDLVALISRAALEAIGPVFKAMSERLGALEAQTRCVGELKVALGEHLAAEAEPPTRELVEAAIAPVLEDLAQRMNVLEDLAEKLDTRERALIERLGGLEAQTRCVGELKVALGEHLAAEAEPPTRELVEAAIAPVLEDLAQRMNVLEDLAEKLDTRERALIERLERTPAPSPGRDGRDGKDGKDAKDGRDGADGTFREPTDYEAGKAYAHGAIVRHRGGLWHAHRASDAVPEAERSGWTLICNGIAATGIEQGQDLRSFVVTLECSDGAEVKRTFALPALIYRGVHKDADAYEAGDAVTHQGSLWVAKRTTSRRPGDAAAAEDWQLAVKKGRDGKDGERGADAPTFRGFYDPRATYPSNALVRTSSGLWLTLKETNDPPPVEAGPDTRSWRLFLPVIH